MYAAKGAKPSKKKPMKSLRKKMATKYGKKSVSK